MPHLVGDLWTFHAQGHPLLIPTSGDHTTQGRACMMSGHALIAARRFPQLAFQLGKRVALSGNHAYFWEDYHLITFPVTTDSLSSINLELLQRSGRETIQLIEHYHLTSLYLAPFPTRSTDVTWQDIERTLERLFGELLTLVRPIP